LRPLDAFHLWKKFGTEGLRWFGLDETYYSVSQTKARLARVAFRRFL
jgi:hypothetical protein